MKEIKIIAFVDQKWSLHICASTYPIFYWNIQKRHAAQLFLKNNQNFQKIQVL